MENSSRNFFQKDEFSTKTGLAHDPFFNDFLMDEFSSKTVWEISQKIANKG